MAGTVQGSRQGIHTWVTKLEKMHHRAYILVERRETKKKKKKRRGKITIDCDEFNEENNWVTGGNWEMGPLRPEGQK